jgi:MFS family permease
MSMMILAPILGGAIGPAIAGAITETIGWRNVLWMSIILATTSEVIFLTCLRETYSVTILSRRVARVREETGDMSLRSAIDISNDNPETDEKGSRRVWDAVLRPFVVFFDSHVLQAISLFGSVMFTYFYIMSTTLPDILSGIYGLSPALTGTSFIIFSMSTHLSPPSPPSIRMY